MKCPQCGSLGEARVLDSRFSDDGIVRRRRECIVCAHRWRTYEVSADRLGEISGEGFDILTQVLDSLSHVVKLAKERQSSLQILSGPIHGLRKDFRRLKGVEGGILSEPLPEYEGEAIS